MEIPPAAGRPSSFAKATADKSQDKYMFRACFSCLAPAITT